MYSPIRRNGKHGSQFRPVLTLSISVPESSLFSTGIDLIETSLSESSSSLSDEKPSGSSSSMSSSNCVVGGVALALDLATVCQGF